MVADRDLEIDVLKEITRKNGRRTRAPPSWSAGRVYPIGDAVCPTAARAPCSRWHGRRWATSRDWLRASGCPGAGRDASFGGRSTLLPRYPRYGYRRIRDFPSTGRPCDEPRAARPARRGGSHPRLWRHAGLQVPRRRPRRRVASGRQVNGRCRRPPGTTCGRTTSCSTTCANRQTLKCLTIVDEWTRECLAIDEVAGGIRSGRS